MSKREEIFVSFAPVHTERCPECKWPARVSYPSTRRHPNIFSMQVVPRTNRATIA